MANLADFTPAEPSRALPGQVLQTSPDDVQAAGHMNNWLMGEYQAGSAGALGWPDGFTHSGAKTVGPTLPIPVISGEHDTVFVTVVFSYGGVGVVTFTADSSVDAVVGASVMVGAQELQLPALTIDPTADFEEIQISIESTMLTTVTVFDVRVDYMPFASPIAAESIDGARPVGELRCGADMPFASRILFRHLRNLPILRARRRPLWSWSGLGSIGPATMQTGVLQRSIVRVWPGSQRAGRLVTARAYVENAAGADRYLYWQAGDLRAGLDQNRGVLVAAAFTGWTSTTFTIDEGAFLDGYPYPAAQIGLHVDLNGGVGKSQMEVHRLLVEGE